MSVFSLYLISLFLSFLKKRYYSQVEKKYNMGATTYIFFY